MKLNMTSYKLVCIVLAQMILIDVILIVFFLKEASRNNPNFFKVSYWSATCEDKSLRGSMPSKFYLYVKKDFIPEQKSGTLAGKAIVTDSASKEFQDRDINSQYAPESKQVLKFGQNSWDILSELKRKITNRSIQVKDLKIPGRIYERKDFIATTYDLSYESCGKYPTHPAYGITYSGRRAVKGRTIAVDPDVIPLGSRVYIEFPPQYEHMNGWYVAEDTGNKVKGNMVDVFLGESAFYDMERFGSKKVNIKILYP